MPAPETPPSDGTAETPKTSPESKADEARDRLHEALHGFKMEWRSTRKESQKGKD